MFFIYTKSAQRAYRGFPTLYALLFVVINDLGNKKTLRLLSGLCFLCILSISHRGKFVKKNLLSNFPYSQLYLKANGVIVAPSKAVNAGGVAVSGLEMSQNSMRYSWSAEEVDAKLKGIMANIFNNSIKAAHDYNLGDDLVAGANIAGFIKVAEAMKAQGVC